MTVVLNKQMCSSETAVMSTLWFPCCLASVWCSHRRSGNTPKEGIPILNKTSSERPTVVKELTASADANKD